MKDYSDHSPLPWAVDDNRPGFEGMIEVFDADGKHVMCFGSMEDCEWRDICDAHTVARAVTAHAALVAALRNLTNACLDAGKDLPEQIDGSLIDAAHAALALAGMSDE